jgi:hypothetical protein
VAAADHGAGQGEADIEDAKRAAGAVETIRRRYAGARSEEHTIVLEPMDSEEGDAGR